MIDDTPRDTWTVTLGPIGRCSRCGATEQLSGPPPQVFCGACGLRLDSTTVVELPVRTDGPLPLTDDQAMLLEALRQPPMALYGLAASWEGTRYLAGWDESPDGITVVELGHARPDGDESVSVLIRGPRADEIPFSVDKFVESVQRQAVNRLPPQERSSACLDVRRTTELIPVDGEHVAFECLSAGSVWLLHGRLEPCNVAIRGAGVPIEGVQLVSLPDLSPYLVDFLP